ncbi:MAG: UDP-3-O-(3-hydroxymyristoyl)glucosamine N-acyltransferase [Gemmatimonadaceae bacterium]|nr:UDP-3-O-(3-hydroxymyristoyl)glucosamine N-acyltransferase [Gemmatimonadaceae bacterium]MCW5825090.1 UDP-3-O-(3-hydroxymyristoyl)glucosamine N-acyltransferase [Gemmatimonadaceae bacterium]
MTQTHGAGLRLAEIAAAVGGTVQGDPETRVSRIAPLDRADGEALSFLASPKYLKLLAGTQAGAILVSPDLKDAPGGCANRVVVAKPHEAILALLPRLYRQPERPFVGVHATAVVDPSAQVDADACVEPYAVIGAGARVGRGAWIGAHCVVGEGVTVGENVRLYPQVTLYPGVQLGSRVAIHSGSRIGSDGFGYVFHGGAHQKIPHVGGCIIGNDVEIGANCTIDRGSIDQTVIGDGTKLDNLVHVAHNVRIGRLCLMAAQVGIAGSVRIGDGVVMAGQVGVSGHVSVGDKATLTAQAGIISDVPSGEVWGGYPARPHKDSLRGYAALAKLPGLLKRLQRLLDREDGA